MELAVLGEDAVKWEKDYIAVLFHGKRRGRTGTGGRAGRIPASHGRYDYPAGSKGKGEQKNLGFSGTYAGYGSSYPIFVREIFPRSEISAVQPSGGLLCHDSLFHGI